MRYEVEQKFPAADLAALERRLADLGAKVSDRRVEADRYYAHPSRDFATTDEAMRIRTTDSSAFITYKGPKLDATTKTRREIDLALPAGQAEAWAELLEALGFRPVAEVRKERRKAHVDWQDRRVEISLDEVQEVGSYVELELVADDEGLASARACIAALAHELGLTASERRSYLELLLERRRVQGSGFGVQ
jgi:adenylate cyclase, class 2